MCGFISIYGPDGVQVIQDILTGLLAIQHRGQDAAGVVTYGEKFQAKKGLGLVREVFQTKHMDRLTGSLAVGHVRYPTVGGNEDTDVQPFWLDYPLGIAMAHNGNISNFHELKRGEFQERGVALASSCDLEVVLYVFADSLLERSAKVVTAEDIWTAVDAVYGKVKGAYSVVGIIANAGMYAFRDPYGIKPIIFGKKKTADGDHFAVASESVVLDVAGYQVIRDLQAGEALFIGRDRVPQFKKIGTAPHRPCIFEYIYFARPDSSLDGVSVYNVRTVQGRKLAASWKKTGLEVDVVIPVPESARTAGQAMAEELGIPYREGFVKNRYIGRTFIMPNDAERKSSIRHKLNPIRAEFEGKRVLILDDSIVRGNTCRQLVKMARAMGAKKVYLASYSAPLRYPCLYGVDMSTKREFIARGKEASEVAADLGADFLLYQTIEDMVAGVKEANGGHIEEFCKACFEGIYPTGDVTEKMLADLEADRIAAHG